MFEKKSAHQNGIDLRLLWRDMLEICKRKEKKHTLQILFKLKPISVYLFIIIFSYKLYFLQFKKFIRSAFALKAFLFWVKINRRRIMCRVCGNRGVYFNFLYFDTFSNQQPILSRKILKLASERKYSFQT